MAKGIIISVVVAILVALVCMNNGKGVVKVEGWAHGVAVCHSADSEYNEPITTISDEGHMWVRNGIMYAVSNGHLGDSELSELVVLAGSVCSQYQK